MCEFLSGHMYSCLPTCLCFSVCVCVWKSTMPHCSSAATFNRTAFLHQSNQMRKRKGTERRRKKEKDNTIKKKRSKGWMIRPLTAREGGRRPFVRRLLLRCPPANPAPPLPPFFFHLLPPALHPSANNEQ